MRLGSVSGIICDQPIRLNLRNLPTLPLSKAEASYAWFSRIRREMKLRKSESRFNGLNLKKAAAAGGQAYVVRYGCCFYGYNVSKTQNPRELQISELA